MLRKLFGRSAAILFALLFASAQVFGQASGQTGNTPLPNALVTLTTQAAGTIVSANQQALYHRGVVCTFNMSAHTGTPSTTFGIQMWDAQSATWQTLVVSGAITADATPTTIAVYPAIAASGPTGYVGFNGHITRVWRVTTTVAGTSPVVTAKIGCELLI